MNQSILLNGNDWLFKGFVGEDWLWRGSHLPGSRDTRGWRSANVPGSVQHDLWRAGVIENPYQGLNSLDIEWVPERTWVYKRVFLVDASLQGSRLFLTFQGVDYSARYYLNGKLLGNSQGLFLPARFEVSEALVYGEENLVVVVIDPAPNEQPQIGYTSRVYTQKPRMNYWWDFCPRMIHLGIWQDVALEVTGPARIEDVWVRPKLSGGFSRATIQIEVDVDQAGEGKLEVGAVLISPGNIELARQDLNSSQDTGHYNAVIQVDDPDLWWPNGAGSQPLYTAVVTVKANQEVSDTRRVPFGVRNIEFIPNEGADPQARPYTLVVNGRRQYIKGWNWVPMDVLYGVERPEKRERLLRLAKNAHINLLRVWGGGLIETEAFYTLCDHLGILVWQEFTQSSSGIDNFPSSDPAFLDLLTKTAEQSIRARRNHPSLAVWCGGNELHYASDRLCAEENPALGALQTTVQRLDPDRYWVPSSPSGGPKGGLFTYEIPNDEVEAHLMHDVHGPWEYQGVNEQYALYNQGVSLLHSEFGVEGITNLRSLNLTIPPDEQRPVSLTNPAWEHLGAWWVKQYAWKNVFGALEEPARLQRATQFMQAEGLRYAVEAERRKQYHNSGTMPWQFNEPYPMAACTSAVDYYSEPKPVYFTVARAYRPVALTAQFDTIAWGGSDRFQCRLFCSNSTEALQGRINAQILNSAGQAVYQEQTSADVPADGSKSLLTLVCPINSIEGPFFFLDLVLTQSTGQVITRSRYLFSTGEDLSPLLDPPPSEVTVWVTAEPDHWQIALKNTSEQPALWVWLEAEKADLTVPGWAYFSDNYFCMMPGETRTIQVDWSGIDESRREVSISGWNLRDTSIRAG